MDYKWLVRTIFGLRRKPIQEVQEVQQRLADVRADDVRVERLEKRVERVLGENNLATDISRALGAR